MNEDSIYYKEYYDYILKDVEPKSKELKAVFNIIKDLTDRRGIKHEFNKIDGGVQDEIIETWLHCIVSVLEEK